MQKQHNPVLDALRFVSILAVLLIHTTTRTLEASSYNLQQLPWTLFLNQTSRFAVPLFFMISGFVLELSHSHNKNYVMYIKKRANRIIIPYVFWSAIYYFLVFGKHKPPFIDSLFAGNASYQLYFIPSLIIFYLLFPLLHKYCSIICNKWSLIILGILQIIILYFDYNIHSISLFYPLSVALLNYFYFIFGIWLSKNQDLFKKILKKWKILLFLGSLLFAFLIFYEGFTGYMKTQNYLKFYSQWRPSVFIYSFLIGGFMYALFDKGFASSKIIKSLSKLSFFVFFVHVAILQFTWLYFLKNIFSINLAKQLWYDPLYFLFVAVASFAIAYVVHKIPYLSKITG